MNPDTGFGRALLAVFSMPATVFLPWFEACFYALILDLRRDLFVWLQLPWFFVLGFAAYRYFFLRVGSSSVVALAFCLPLMAIRAVFYFDGGLSDFRMDLLQYLLLGATFLIYLSISQAAVSASLSSWAVCGGMAGLSCLARTTTPVYLLLVFGPLFAIDLLRARRNFADVLRRYATAALALILVAGWFYLLNFRYLHYYYFVWNTAANEKLPLSLSLDHVGILFGQNIGWPIVALLGICIGLGAIQRLNAGLPLWKDLNWRALWLGATPLSFLVFWGAGLNPFVSMLAATGFLVFGEAAWISPAGPRPRWMEMTLVVAALAASLLTAATGIASHTVPPGWVPKAAAIDTLLQLLTTDISQRPPGHYGLSFVHSGSIEADVVMNCLTFDKHLPYNPDGSISLGKSLIQVRNGTDRIITRVDWERLAGATDAAKIQGQVDSILRDSDYLLVPTAASQLSNLPYVNAYVPELRRRLLASGRLTPLGPAVALTPYESAGWYRINRGN